MSYKAYTIKKKNVSIHGKSVVQIQRPIKQTGISHGFTAAQSKSVS